ncbi:MAG TPA: response regulator [Phenylobacterium sp.]|jgi:DNA-binding response OmpR family regulator|uniref:response regulator n=1 Tax=Phenylobacterium sp. TaxID=1871053 RepID=UPI002D6AED5C|nr:response regulator [Phenylobacterium sp.]HZZ67446.1 response regulator [Phenylobacterium sp.]
MSALRLVQPETESRTCGRVLLIDDDAALLGLMAHAFAAAGYATRTAENGRKGLLALDSYQPDLVVTDIVMPEMEGIGAILQIKRRPKPPKIIAISGAGPGGRRDYLSWAKHLGADEVLAKPFRMSQILTLAGRLIDNHSNHLAKRGS